MKQLFFMLALAVLLGCSTRASLQGYYIECLNSFQLNNIARDRGCSDFVRVKRGTLNWHGAEYQSAQLELSVEDSLAQQRLSREEIKRMPFVVVAEDGATFGDVMRTLDIGEGIGFQVKGCFYVGTNSNDSVVDNVSELNLPELRHGCLGNLSELNKLCRVKVYRDGKVLVNDRSVAPGGPEFRSALLRVMSMSLCNGIYLPVIMADVDVGFGVVKKVLDACVLSGYKYVFLVGRANHSSNISHLRYILVGIPCPDDFFWTSASEDD